MIKSIKNIGSKFLIIIIALSFAVWGIGDIFLPNGNNPTIAKVSRAEIKLNESQLDFFYLTSPSMIEKKINHLDNHNYIVMEYSKIFLSMNDFMNLDTKYAIQEIENEKKTKKR